MTFKTRPSTYRLSLAPTGRAHCRGCKRRVEKSELRFTITAFVRPGRSTCLVRCCECIDAKFARAVFAVYGTAAHVPVDACVATADGVRAALALLSAVDKSLECAVEGAGKQRVKARHINVEQASGGDVASAAAAAAASPAHAS